RKPLEWRGGRWAVKNLLELKNARRVRIEGNLLENNWAAAQSGTAILFTPRNQDGKAPWSEVSDVLFQHNILRHAVNGITVLATDDIRPSRPTRNIRILHNLFYDLDGQKWGSGPGGVLLGLNGPGARDIVLAHNTAVHTGACVVFESNVSVNGLVIRDNIMGQHILGHGMAGTEALGRFAGSTWQLLRNVIVVGERPDYWENRYPADNFYLVSYRQVGFIDPDGGDFQLKPSSRYKGKATDGKDVGAHLDAP
ncbi:MAG: hypothetical protein ACRD68_17435, partial [Pyrinomonadaceae bacterium]